MRTSSADAVLHVVSQLELDRVGLQVVLFAQIGLVIFPHIVVDQGGRDNEGDVAIMPPV